MWEASQYCWAGSCKNHFSHPRRNIFHRHGSPLGYALVLRLLPSLIRRRGLPSHLLPFLHVCTRRCAMFDSQLYRKLSLTAAVLGFLTVAACSNQPGMVASRQSVHAAGGAASGAATDNPAGDFADATQRRHLVTVPKGTEITATVGQTLASDKDEWGDSVGARIARPPKGGRKNVAPRIAELLRR